MSTNESNDSCTPEMLQSLIDSLMVAQDVAIYYYLTIFFAAACLNLKLAVTILSDKQLSRSETLYPKVLTLVIAHMVPVFAMVLGHIDRLLLLAHTADPNNDTDLHDILFCKFPVFIQSAANVVGSWTIVMLTIERCVAIKYPLAFHLFQTRCRLLIGIFILVVVAILLTSPKLLTMTNHKLTEDIVICDARTTPHVVYQLDLIYTGVLFGIITVLPCVILSIVSALLIFEVQKAKRRSLNLHAISSPSSGNFQQVAIQANRGTIVVLVLAIVYAFLQIPDVVIWIISYQSGGRTQLSCKSIIFNIEHTYMSMIGNSVAITNPMIVLGFKYCCTPRSSQRNSNGSAVSLMRVRRMMWPKSCPSPDRICA